jgi:hypothetical protein
MDKEIFKDIPGYEGLYQVSNLGNVKSLGNGKARIERILKIVKNKRGYYQVSLCKEGKMKCIKVHQLVAMTFLAHKLDGTMKIVPDHKDMDKSNNCVSNIELITQRENIERYWLTKKKSSKYIGVIWYKKANKWQARIYIDGRLKHLGLFTDEYEAHLAYQKALNELK